MVTDPPMLFVSHSSKDLDRVRELLGCFTGDDRLRFWLSVDDIGVGRSYAQSIWEAIHNCDALLVILSEDALRSEQVRREVGLAVGYGKRILPVQLTDGLLNSPAMTGDWQYWLHTTQVLRWTTPSATAGELLRSLGLSVHRNPPPVAEPKPAPVAATPPPSAPARPRRRVPWPAIGAVAGVISIPLTIIIAMMQGGGGGSVGSQPTTGTPAAVSTRVAPTAGSQPTGNEDCVRADGTPVGCGATDAMLPTNASPCDRAGATRALGMNPDIIELLIDVVPQNDGCAVGPTAEARAAGATVADLLVLRRDELPAALAACWPDSPTSGTVPCATAHRFEPVTAWAPVQDPGVLADTCRSAAARYVAGQVDVVGGKLSSRSLQTQEDSPRFRCVVESSVPLDGSVYRLSGRELPTV